MGAILGNDELRDERDRFVAFAFAAADLLVQIMADRRISFASGAAQSLLGVPASLMLDRDVMDFFDPAERSFMVRMLERLTVAGRIEPVNVLLRHKSGKKTRVSLGACRFPGADSESYLTFTHHATAFPVADEERDPETRLLSAEAFGETALRLASSPADPRGNALVMLQLDGLDRLQDGLPEAVCRELRLEIAGILRSASIGGDAAGQVGPNTFSYVQGADGDTRNLKVQLVKAAESAAPDQPPLGVTLASIALDLDEMRDQDAGQALAYCIKRFSETQGEGFSLSSLKSGFSEMVNQTIAKVESVRQVVRQANFDLAYQPIVDLSTGDLHHYEVLSRFPAGQSPYELVTFSEEVGLVEELDLAVCTKVVESQRTAAVAEHIAINISGRSLQSPVFLDRLMTMLRRDVRDPKRMIFEITESAAIKNLEEANNFAQMLRRRGHPICLDDFGAGFTAYAYLRRFEVDYVKLDGPFLKASLSSQRDATLIRSLCALCHELKCASIGEMIENKAEAEGAMHLGIRYGQGYYFGKPQLRVRTVSSSGVAG